MLKNKYQAALAELEVARKEKELLFDKNAGDLWRRSRTISRRRTVFRADGGYKRYGGCPNRTNRSI